MSEWHRERGYVHLSAIDACYEMAQFVSKRLFKAQEGAAWEYIELGAELNGLQWVRLRVTFALDN